MDNQGWNRSHDQARGQNFRPEGGHQGRNSQNKFRGTSKRGRQNFPGSSPGGFRGGHSPSQRDDLRWFSSGDTGGCSQENHKRERLEPQNWRTRPLSESPREDLESNDGNAHKSGKRRNRNRKTSSENLNEAVNEEPSAISDPGLWQAERRLKRDGINPLRKAPNSHPNAVYSCSFCDIYLDSVADAYKHIFKDRRHKKKSKEQQEQELLTQISPPSAEQVSAINTVLEDLVREYGLTDQDVEARQQAVSLMQDLLLSVMPGITLRLYGSSCTKFGFKKSDVNIDIQFPPEMTQPNVLFLVKECLSVSPLYVELEADFHARVPVVVCKEKKSGLICKVSAGNENAFQTTSYLSAIVRQEPLLLPLVLGLRRWAQICQIDRPEEGGFPSYALALLVIYFLQQRRQALLPTYLNQEIKVFSLSRLKDFSLTHVDDEHVHWIYSPSSKESSQSADKSSLNGKVPLVFQHPHPPVEVGLLWVELLRFYSLEFKMEDYVISVRTRAVLSREMKDWPKKRIAVEDPFAVKRNVARSVNSQQVYDYIVHCLKTTYKYFALPPNTAAVGQKLKGKRDTDATHNSDANKLIIEPQSLNQSKNIETGPEDSDCIIEEELEEDSESEKDREKVDLGKGSLSEEEDEADAQIRRHVDSLTTEDEELFPLDEISGEEPLSEDERPDLDTPDFMDKVEELYAEYEDDRKLNKLEGGGENHGLSYRFNKQAFTRGKTHIVVCSLCKRDGHLKKDCPEDFKKVELDPLPPMTSDFLRVLDQVCVQCHTDFAPGELEERVRDHILQDLQTFIRRHFPDTKLQLFGSSKNGFGFRQSDLDICMMLEGRDTLEDDDCIHIIEILARLLKKHSGLKNILPITTAKVPIVKFYHLQTGLEGDISLYNTLALHNTHLLASYAEIDARVRILCYVMKVFAKMCDIGDASRGSLSSYAYTLMVLFYLQQRDPPVIPVLQEMYDGQKPEKLVDGWNVYFFDDLAALASRWSHYGKNRETVGELWLGLLRFYTEDFDFREHVICIRQHARLTTFNKQWTSKLIAIEDPFDLNHNLGAGLSRKMINFIMKAFINSRKVFGTPVEVIPIQYPSAMEYFFDPEVLTEGEVAPNDRCCRICGKIGHFMKDCPMRRKSRHRQDSEKGADTRESSMDRVKNRNEQWRKRDPLERCCFLCGSNSHMKKDCHLYKGPAGNLGCRNMGPFGPKKNPEK
ncbi:terminal uridylyltransferase 7 isoform X2 [Eucyclogobius newberryi]|uniref:terminal uridylyltransferase 7 isoform X2 n=1 Tax=Eucyclogobius newberryi TaxID=166745 RepID=UPI003B599196